MAWVTVVRLELELLEPLHVGSQERLGHTLLALKLSVVEPGSGAIRRVPVVPRTSVKGLLRALAERLAKSMAEGSSDVYSTLCRLHHQPTLDELDERREMRFLRQSVVHSDPTAPLDRFFSREVREVAGARACVAVPSPQAPSELRDWFLKYLEWLKSTPRAQRLLEPLAEHPDRAYEEFASLACPVCRLFGSPLLGSSVRLTDLVPAGEAGLAVRSHVSIERARGVRAHGKLFSVEYLEPGTKMVGYMLVVKRPLPSTVRQELRELLEGAWRKSMELLEALRRYLESVDLEVALGGHKSRGYGAARLRMTPVAMS